MQESTGAGGGAGSARALLPPGTWVRHPAQLDWGDGQVQSVVGTRVTVNFEHAGKVVVDTRHVTLDLAES